MVEERAKNTENMIVGINHGDDLETAESLKEKLESKYGIKEFSITAD